MPNQPNRVGGILERIDQYPEHLKAIGLIITDFASLEGRLAILFWEVLGDAARGAAVFWALGNAKARCDIIRAVATEVFSDNEWAPLRAEIGRVVKRVQRAATRRNDIAHGQWGRPYKGDENPFMTLERPASKDRLFQRRWTVRQLMEVADEIREAEKEVNNVTQAILYVRDPRVRLMYDQIRTENPRTDAYLRKILPPSMITA